MARNTETMTLFPTIPCGHELTNFKDGICMKPCEVLLSCGDICKGTCSTCQQGRVHVLCSQDCGKMLICGHLCNFPCKMFCPPCPERCTKKCSHRKCDNICGSPCEPCKEPCTWACSHLQCSKACSDPCDRDMCEEVCLVTLKCGHPCVGVCGEECPPCRTCNAEQFTPIFDTEEESKEGARFILLFPCEHPVELISLRKWLVINQGDEITVKKCPKCTTIIQNCLQLPEVKANNKIIDEIKSKEYGNISAVKEKATNMFTEMSAPPFHILHERDLPNTSTVYAETSIVYSLSRILETTLKENNICNNSLNKYKLDTLSFKFNFIKSLKIIVDKYWKQYNETIKEEMFNRAHSLFRLMSRLEYFQKQQLEDFKVEINRLNNICELEFVCSSGEYLSNKKKPNVKQLYSKTKELVYNTIIYSEKQSKEFENKLQHFKTEIDMACQLTVEERKSIHYAMCTSFNQGNTAQGHWIKCQCGYIYCITECGGADQLSTCPECQGLIGGERHRYVESARVATEMDGARYFAWSAQNDINNYDLEEN